MSAETSYVSTEWKIFVVCKLKLSITNSEIEDIWSTEMLETAHNEL